MREKIVLDMKQLQLKKKQRKLMLQENRKNKIEESRKSEIARESRKEWLHKKLLQAEKHRREEAAQRKAEELKVCLSYFW